MNMQMPPPTGANGTGRRRPPRTPKGRQVDPPRSMKCARCSPTGRAGATC